MRRTYAFEAEGVSEEVKAQLEKVEDVVEEKCDNPEACQKMLDKIDAEEDKYNDALKTMRDAASDCKDGKCDKAEMAATISPKMAELKEVAKSIGVASEGETLTEQELKDAKDYLEGAKEIVEAKMDEVSNDGGDEGSGEIKKTEDPEGNDDDDDDDDDGDEGMESFFANLEPATEGQTWQAIKGVLGEKARSARKYTKMAKTQTKSGDNDGAIKSLQAAKKLFAESKAELQKLPKDMWDTIASWLTTGWVAIIVAAVGGFDQAPNKNVNVAAAINYLDQAMAKIDRKIAALKSGNSDDVKGASESDMDFGSFIAACESYSIAKKSAAPYLFD